jgi:hypothetical protein
MPSQTDSVHTSPGHSSTQPLRPSTGGFPDDLAHRQTLRVAFPRSQYCAPSATLRPLQPQVVQSPRDRSQRLPRSRDCPLHSGLGRSWTPIRCSLHPRRGPYACTPLAGTVWPIGPLARSVRKPRYATTHAILISSQRVHASDALNGAFSRSHTGIQAGGLRGWMRCCPLPLVPSGFGRVLPPCPSPAELASGLMFSMFRCKLYWNIAPTWLKFGVVWCPLLAKFTGDLCRPSPGSLRFRANGSHHCMEPTPTLALSCGVLCLRRCR